MLRLHSSLPSSSPPEHPCKEPQLGDPRSSNFPFREFRVPIPQPEAKAFPLCPSLPASLSCETLFIVSRKENWLEQVRRALPEPCWSRAGLSSRAKTLTPTDGAAACRHQALPRSSSSQKQQTWTKNRQGFLEVDCSSSLTSRFIFPPTPEKCHPQKVQPGPPGWGLMPKLSGW